MSKSTGTGIGAREAMERWGADVLRLWTASVEFVDDVRFGPNVVDQIGRVYRNLRNRIRFMLGNVDDLAKRCDRSRATRWSRSIDSRAPSRMHSWPASVVRTIRFALHDAYLQIVEFESAMSSLYFDALKDPLYSARAATRAGVARSRRCSTYWTRLLVALAPVLSFTAEEAWQSLPEALRGDAASVFDLELRDGDPADSAAGRWQQLRDLRARVAASQSPRDFEAKVRLGAPARSFDWLASLGDNLREALVVSEVELFRSEDETETFELLSASGEKCARCWKFRQLGSDPANPLVCSDCAEVLSSLDL